MKKKKAEDGEEVKEKKCERERRRSEDNEGRRNKKWFT